MVAIEEPVLIDTGPFVAWMNTNDKEYQACAEVFLSLPVGKSYTCWPVLTEAAYLMRARLKLPDPNKLLESVVHHELELLRLRRQDIQPMQRVFTKYYDQEVDLADAALLQLAERENINTIFTTDRRHFRVYRRLNGTPFRLLPDDIDG